MLLKRQFRITPLFFGAVLAVVGLQLGILYANERVARRLQQDAVAINLAGRQRMLAEGISRDLLLLARPGLVAERRDAVLSALGHKRALFADTLQAFAEGGETAGLYGRPHRLVALRDSASVAVLAQLRAYWKGYEPLLAAVQTGNGGSAALVRATAYSLGEGGARLLQTADRLTQAIEAHSRAQARTLRIWQSGAAFLALLGFLLLVYWFWRQWRGSARSERLLRRLLDRVGSGVLLIDQDGRIAYANELAATLFAGTREQLMGCAFSDLIREAIPGAESTEAFRGRRLDGTRFEARLGLDELGLEEMYLEGRPVRVATVVDVTRQRALEAQLRHLAHHDALTALPNRLAFETRLREALSAAERHGRELALLFVDLDGFKPVNDSYGHGAGDQLLVDIAERLRDGLRTEDVVARVGGDEFAVLLGQPEQAEVETAARAVAEKLIAVLQQPFRAGEEPVHIGASIGIALYPRHGTALPALMAAADAAMYAAKARGGGVCRVAGEV